MQREMTLAGLIEGLGYEVVRVEVAPGGLDISVGDPVIHDRLAGTSIVASDVVLAVGVDPRGPELLDLLEVAGRAGAAAVIAKLMDGQELDSVVAAASRARIALLRLSRDVEWGQFHALVRMVTATSAAPRDGSIPLGDLFALANAISVRAHGPVTIEDAQSRVLAYSTGDEVIDEYRRDTILGRRVPESWVRRLQQDGAFQRIWHGDGPVRISYSPAEPGYRDRLVIAVRAGGEVVGTIWIQEGSEPLGDDHELLLREVAPLAALHLARHLAGDLERRQEAELLKAVLAGRVPPASLSEQLSVRTGQTVAVLGVRPVCSDEVESTMYLGRVSSVIALFRRSEQVQLVQTWSADTLYVVVTGGDRLDAILRHIADRARTSLNVPVKVALARSSSGLDTVVAARQVVDDVLSVCDSLPGTITEFDDVLGAVLLVRWRRAAAAQPDLCAGRIEVLHLSDRERDTQYVATLRAFLDRFGDVITASADLGVHPNTFRYRLRRALDTAGIDLDDPVERLMAHLQLCLFDTADRDPS